MALKPTIYKIQLNLADSDRHLYDDFTLTLAQHPSETLERLTARLLAFALHAAPNLSFTRGLSTTDEPDLWQHSDSGEIVQWIEVGQAEEPRLRKACGRAQQVSVLAFGKSASTWWKLNAESFSKLERLAVTQLDWAQVQAAAALVQRNCKLSLSIAGGTIYLDNGSDSVSLEAQILQSLD
ncbi:YaeQ family protein [Parahaliea sp. F7430]|uniref:YaeQ family protein n=1 Tax=Sediminihaliea albiluteola TaxID=2758564 RepID=A0A7W2TTE3_9GAMM|nr:YaeQ family protein [Sediminihaliea albiluteola]MBA6411538.1 YaeQ family protein [Sediminihaliea albiluteola]